ncbi:hypothetical protein QVD17_09384 [Tagetes erecta]|uniref:Uncharacterized protein n=1 Tax=Tagetes erecta TaxID=13708 RepID=A0AAD8L0H7_TARER|nr:hypothetical protein QVD17_09384 [Tagetes erecta]
MSAVCGPHLQTSVEEEAMVSNPPHADNNVCAWSARRRHKRLRRPHLKKQTTPKVRSRGLKSNRDQLGFVTVIDYCCNSIGVESLRNDDDYGGVG